MFRNVTLTLVSLSACLAITAPSRSESTTCAYVSSSSNKTLVVVNMDRAITAGEIETGFGTTSIDTARSPSLLFALDRFRQAIAVVDLHRRRVTRTVDVSVAGPHEFPFAENLAVSEDGAFIAVATSNTGLGDRVTVWDASTFMPVYSFGDVARPLAVATNDGTRVYVANSRASTTVFDLVTESFDSLPVLATNLQLSSDGGLLLSAFEPLGPVVITALEDDVPQVQVGRELEVVYDAAFSQEEHLVLVAAGNSGIFAFSTEDQEKVAAFDVGTHVIRIAPAPDNRLLAAASRSGEFFIVDLISGRFQQIDLSIDNVSKIAIAEIPRGCGVDCVGDCDRDGNVEIAELALGVASALKNTPPSTCDAFDRNGDGSHAIAEIIEAVRNALTGCPVVMDAADKS